MPYFDFKLNSVYIKNNRDLRRAELQIFSFVSADTAISESIFTDFLQVDDKSRQNILEKAASNLLATRQIIQVKNIPDNFRMNFGLNGISLYREHNIPEYFDWDFAIFESDEGIRKFGEKLNNIINKMSSQGVFQHIIAAAMITMTPQVYAISKLSQFVGKAVALELMENQDDQVCVYCESFNRYENYPQLNLKGVDVEDMTGNCKISYSIFGKE